MSHTTLNVPKSLHHAPSGTSGFVEIQFMSFTISSPVMVRSRRRSCMCFRRFGGRCFQSMCGTGLVGVVHAEDHFLDLLPLLVGVGFVRFGLEFPNEFTQF